MSYPLPTTFPYTVSWDSRYDLATFTGPGGFTQVTMTLRQAQGIAQAMGARFYESVPGTTAEPV